jgi:hypothetical protein
LELFKVLNLKFFSIFNSKNREVYVETLFALKELFMTESIIEKDVVVSKLVHKLEKNVLINFDAEEEDEIKNKSYKDAKNTANYIIRKLEECGWIEQEYNQLSNFRENIVLPPYSVRLINVLHEITKESDIVFSSHIYSIYSNLLNADVNSPEYRYSALSNAKQSFDELINTLKMLAHELRRRQRVVTILSTSNEILAEHFDDYTKNILEQIYLPLKTQDSIQRFKGIILEILYRWMRSPSTIEGIAKNAYDKNRFSDQNEAENFVLDLIGKITENLDEVEKIVSEIDTRHNAYIAAVSEKLKSLIYTNRSVKKKLTTLLEVFMSGNEVYQRRLIETTSNSVNFQRQGYVDTDSMFVRAGSLEKEITPPQPILVGGEEENTAVTDFVESSIKSPYSSTSVVEYIRDLMQDRNSLDYHQWQLDDTGELIKAIIATIRGFDSNVFYSTDIDENERLVSGQFSVPKTTFVRRRKL